MGKGNKKPKQKKKKDRQEMNTVKTEEIEITDESLAPGPGEMAPGESEVEPEESNDDDEEEGESSEVEIDEPFNLYDEKMAAECVKHEIPYWWGDGSEDDPVGICKVEKDSFSTEPKRHGRRLHMLYKRDHALVKADTMQAKADKWESVASDWEAKSKSVREPKPKKQLTAEQLAKQKAKALKALGITEAQLAKLQK